MLAPVFLSLLAVVVEYLLDKLLAALVLASQHHTNVAIKPNRLKIINPISPPCSAQIDASLIFIEFHNYHEQVKGCD